MVMKGEKAVNSGPPEGVHKAIENKNREYVIDAVKVGICMAVILGLPIVVMMTSAEFVGAIVVMGLVVTWIVILRDKIKMAMM